MWAHRVTRGDVALVRRSPFPVLVLHGRSDLLAPPKRGAALAARLGGAYVELEGAHFLTRERGPEVNALVRSVVGGDLAGGSTSTRGGGAAASSASSPALRSLASVDADPEDADHCGGWAAPDPHRDLVPKQGWWRHRQARLRGSMTRLSSALTGAGGSMAALAAHASAAAVAAATAAAERGQPSSSSLASALSTPLVIDDATTDVLSASASPPVRAPSPAPRLVPHAPPTSVVGGDDLRYASSPEPWSRETSFDDARVEGCCGTVEWISPPGDGSGGGGGGGGLGASASGSDDGRDWSPAVVLKGAALVSPAGSPPPRHRRHHQHLSFMTKRCSTAEAGGTPPAVSSLVRNVAAPAVATKATPSSSLFGNDNARWSPSPSAEPPRTPPHASGNSSTGSDGTGNGSLAFKRRSGHLSSDDDLRGSSEDDERRHGSQCPFVDPVARGMGAIVDSSYDGDE